MGKKIAYTFASISWGAVFTIAIIGLTQKPFMINIDVAAGFLALCVLVALFPIMAFFFEYWNVEK